MTQPSKPVVLVAEELAPAALEQLAGDFDVRHTDGSDREQLLPALAGSVVLAALLSALGLVLTAFTKRGFFGMAAIIGVYLLTSAAVSIVRQVGLGAGHPEVVRYAGLLSPFDMVAGFQDWVLGTRPGGAPPDVTAGAVYTAVILAVIAGCTGVLLWRYRKVTT